MNKTFYIIDGHSQIHRAYHAPFPPLSCYCVACKGSGQCYVEVGGEPDYDSCTTCLGTGQEPTKATYVFTKYLLKLLNTKKPDFICMTTDGPRAELIKRRWYPPYKGDRGDNPSDIYPQVVRIKQIVQALGITQIQVKGYEADDVIATLATEARGVKDLDVIIVSRDKDLMQLVDSRCKMYDPMSETTYDSAAVEAKFKVKPHNISDYLALMGDTADSIPGISGFGEKTAAKYLNQYGCLDVLLNYRSSLPPKLAAALTPEAVELNRKLVRLEDNVRLTETYDFRWRGLNLTLAQPIFRMLGFKRWE